MASPWRYIAQRATTGEFLHWDLPIARDELRWDLSGPGSLQGTVSPDVGQLRDADGRLILEEWGTKIYAEADGQIRWGGLVLASAFEGASWKIEAAGMSTYLNGTPYLGDYRKTSVDPMDAARELWRHAQSFEDGDLGVVVDDTRSGVTIGSKDEPYVLAWYEAKDCGEEFDSLARLTPFDYREEHVWSGDEIEHRLILGHPRLGRRRRDLAFVMGDNVSNVVPVSVPGDEFANGVYGLGKGEGAATIHAEIPTRDGRLRRMAVYTDKGEGSTAALRASARAELARRSLAEEISQVDVTDHPNAPIGSWSVGDDVLIEATLPWLGDVAVWSRITSWALVGEHKAQLNLTRSDRFDYGRPLQ